MGILNSFATTLGQKLSAQAHAPGNIPRTQCAPKPISKTHLTHAGQLMEGVDAASGTGRELASKKTGLLSLPERLTLRSLILIDSGSTSANRSSLLKEGMTPLVVLPGFGIKAKLSRLRKRDSSGSTIPAIFHFTKKNRDLQYG
jgi:hypothetical protein